VLEEMWNRAWEDVSFLGGRSWIDCSATRCIRSKKLLVVLILRVYDV
jgi:hypothetical protein